MTLTTPLDHSDLVGGSTAARRIGCPRSYALEQKVPKDETGSVYAQEGTALHEIMAIALEQDRDPLDMLPFTYTARDGSWSFTVDHDLWMDKGEPALRAFDKFVVKQEQRLGEPMRFLIETRVEFPGIPGAFGTTDITARCGNEIFVLDWKFGRGIVPAEENKQLLFYAAGALNTSRAFFDGMTLTAATPVTLAIIQPERADGIDVWTTDMLRLHHYEIELQAAVQTIREEGLNAPVQDGPWCRFARCKAVCPLHLGAARKLADRFGDLQAAMAGPKVGIDDSGGFALKCQVCGRGWRDTEDAPCKCHEINDWPERYADLLELVDIVEDFCTEVRERAHHAAEQGMDIPGWVLEAKRAGGRRWAVEEDQVVKTFEEEGYDLDQIAPRKLLTLPQMEKILKRDGKVIPDGFTEQPEPNGTKLVRAKNATAPVEAPAVRAARLAEKLMRL